MKISVKLTIDVDEKTWADTYGIVPGAVRENVRDWVAHTALGAAEQADNGLTGVTLR